MLSRRQAFATLAAMLPRGVAAAGNEDKLDDEKLLGVLVATLKHLQTRVEDLDELVRQETVARKYLQLTSPPIGSVQAFAGDWPTYKADGKTKWSELDIGWLLCDGRNLDDLEKQLHNEVNARGKPWPDHGILAALRADLPQIDGKPAERLPDYRGMFLRGIDRGMDGETRNNDKDGIRAVGTEQGFATAMPKKTFSAKPNGKHSHAHLLEMNASRNPNGNVNNTVAQPEKGGDRRTAEDGEHRHEIDGGDDETRPINVAVNFIIKFQ